jgi:hypothetical protein
MATLLTRIGDTTLYKPGGGETYVFLLWDVSSPPQTIPLDETWADDGSPLRVGDYVFLLSVPPPDQAPALEKRLRTLFSAPETTGFGWVAAKDELSTAVNVALTGGLPAIAADTPVRMPPSAIRFTFLANLPVLASTDGDGKMNGLVMTQPRPGSAAGAAGASIALSGPIAGCIRFTGALESVVSGDATTKQLADVLIDPLRLTNPKRTYILPTGVRYTLTRTVTGYTFYPA